MKLETFAPLAFLALRVSALSNSIGLNHGIHQDAMISYQKIYLGWAPGYMTAPGTPNNGGGITIPELNADSGQKAATYNLYAQILNSDIEAGKYTDPKNQFDVDEINDSGAVLVASLMPEMNSWSDITPSYAQSIASFFEDNFTSKGTKVWLRFAHEVNYYAAIGKYPAGVHYAAFKQAWQNVYAATSKVDGLYLWWCPNEDTSSEPVAPWWPGPEYVDIVGMDVYPTAADVSSSSFSSAYGSFYNTYAKANNIPFAIGETGVGANGGQASEQQLQQWLKAVINPSNEELGNYPLYFSATWYETGQPVTKTNFYVVYDQPKSIVEQTVSNTEAGS